MPCKSLRFLVSPLTVPVEHDRRRCTGRNTIISAVNKFLRRALDEIELSDRFPGIASWRRSKSSPRYIFKSLREAVTGDFPRSTARESECARARARAFVCAYVCARSSDRSQFFAVAAAQFEADYISSFHLPTRSAIHYRRSRTKFFAGSAVKRRPGSVSFARCARNEDSEECSIGRCHFAKRTDSSGSLMKSNFPSRAVTSLKLKTFYSRGLAILSVSEKLQNEKLLFSAAYMRNKNKARPAVKW